MSVRRPLFKAVSKKLVYEDDKYADSDAVIASKRMLKAAGVEMVQLLKRIRIAVEVD